MVKEVVVGQIKAAHGLEGQFKINTFTTKPENIFNYSSVSIGSQYREVILIKHKSLGNGFLVSCKEIKIRNEVEDIIKENISIVSDQLPNIFNRGSYYYSDLVEFSVLDESGNIIGNVISVSNYGSDDIIEIQTQKKDKTFLIPFNKTFIESVDKNNNYLEVKNIQEYI